MVDRQKRISDGTAVDKVSVGGIVSFGAFGGKPLNWLVLDVDAQNGHQARLKPCRQTHIWNLKSIFTSIRSTATAGTPAEIVAMLKVCMRDKAAHHYGEFEKYVVLKMCWLPQYKSDERTQSVELVQDEFWDYVI